MSKTLPLLLVATVALGSNLAGQQPGQPAPAQTPAVETDPDYILDAAFSLGAYRLGPRVTNPSVLREVKPAYTPDALRRQVQGEVTLSIRIGAEGTVEAVRIRKSLDRGGLDVEAMRAARQWLFKPATLDGTAVPVMADLVLKFSLDKEPPAPPR